MSRESAFTVPDAAAELLESFYGAEGSDYEIIRDYSAIDINTKIRYLQKAVSETEVVFLASLDRLYAPIQIPDEEKKQIEFLATLKRINTLATDGVIRYRYTSEVGIENKPLVKHLFASIVSAEALEKIKKNADVVMKYQVFKMIDFLLAVEIRSIDQVDFFVETPVVTQSYFLRNPAWRNKFEMLPNHFYCDLSRVDMLDELVTTFPMFLDLAYRTGIHVNGLLTEAIFHLVRDCNFHPKQALLEFKDLNEYQKKALATHYWVGLRKSDLQHFHVFAEVHQAALDYFLLNQKLPLDKVMRSLCELNDTAICQLHNRYQEALQRSQTMLLKCLDHAVTLTDALNFFELLDDAVLAFIAQTNLPVRAQELNCVDLCSMHLTHNTIDTLTYLLHYIKIPIKSIVCCLQYLDRANFIAAALDYSKKETVFSPEETVQSKINVFNRIAAVEILRRREWSEAIFDAISEKIMALSEDKLKIEALFTFGIAGLSIDVLDSYQTRSFSEEDKRLLTMVARDIKPSRSLFLLSDMMKKAALFTAEQLAAVLKNLEALPTTTHQKLYLFFALMHQKPVDDARVIVSTLTEAQVNSWVETFSKIQNKTSIDELYSGLLQSVFNFRDKKLAVLALLNKFVGESESTVSCFSRGGPSQKVADRLAFVAVVTAAQNLNVLSSCLQEKLNARIAAGKNKSGLFQSRNYTDCLSACVDIVSGERGAYLVLE